MADEPSQTNMIQAYQDAIYAMFEVIEDWRQGTEPDRVLIQEISKTFSEDLMVIEKIEAKRQVDAPHFDFLGDDIICPELTVTNQERLNRLFRQFDQIVLVYRLHRASQYRKVLHEFLDAAKQLQHDRGEQLRKLQETNHFYQVVLNLVVELGWAGTSYSQEFGEELHHLVVSYFRLLPAKQRPRLNSQYIQASLDGLKRDILVPYSMHDLRQGLMKFLYIRGLMRPESFGPNTTEAEIDSELVNIELLVARSFANLEAEDKFLSY